MLRYLKTKHVLPQENTVVQLFHKTAKFTYIYICLMKIKKVYLYPSIKARETLWKYRRIVIPQDSKI